MLKSSDIYSIESNYTKYIRRNSSVVNVGDISIGGEFDVVVQSMATVDTNLYEQGANQAQRIFEAGAEMVRFTAQGVKESVSLGKIRNILKRRGIYLPLVADIHFNLKAAFEAAKQVEKVRINPGNFIDKKGDSECLNYSDEQYKEQLDELEIKFSDFLDVCFSNSTAIRIGVNHGSLSDRIMSRYGDTPRGMTESAMEFLRICKRRNFTNTVVSMKSSNTVTMVISYRMLCEAMASEDMGYPIHLGVTEAGEGNDARIRSAVGIGALLNDGIGDTIRVSLTEKPENEIPVAQCLVDYYKNRNVSVDASEVDFSKYKPYFSNSANSNVPFVIFDISRCDASPVELLEKYPNDYVYIGTREAQLSNSRIITNSDDRICYVTLETLKSEVIEPHKIIVIEAVSPQYHRAVALYIQQLNLPNVVVLKRIYSVENYDELLVHSSADFGGVLIDGFGDGIWISTKCTDAIEHLPLSILQSTRRRISKAEYISCPGCGRTLYDLESVVKELKVRTSELKSIKIAIMGCIVNGPGEMADADYGYVGAARGLVTLYKKQEVVQKNVPQEEAIDKLIELIKTNNDWR